MALSKFIDREVSITSATCAGSNTPGQRPSAESVTDTVLPRATRRCAAHLSARAVHAAVAGGSAAGAPGTPSKTHTPARTRLCGP